MAKLKARGRREIFRVHRAKVPAPGDFHDDSVAEVHYYRSLETDGSVLERTVLVYTPEEVRKNYGKTRHDYGWKVRGKIKAGLSAEQALGGYLAKGWELEDASPAYFREVPGGIEGVSQDPVVSEAKAARRKVAATKRKEKASVREREESGPGFYVTNGYTGPGLRSRVADHPSPFASYEEAEEWAWERLRHLNSMSLDYLLPVLVVEAASRRDAEADRGYVWWENGKRRGPPVDPRQEVLFR